jgi:hypothetical protein
MSGDILGSQAFNAIARLVQRGFLNHMIKTQQR